MNTFTQPVAAIVVAAGSGSRLGADLPKALVELDGVPLVRRSVDALVRGGAGRIVVTVPEGGPEAFEAALDGVAVPVVLVVGGQRRQDSVGRGLSALGELPGDAIVLIHDAARPLVPAAVVHDVIAAVAGGAAAAIPALPVVDSIRALDGGSSTVVDRSNLRAVQTPQGFRLDIVAQAHHHLEERALEVTDDASACQLLGHQVTLVPGHRYAFKITEPIDLILAAAIAESETA